KPTSMSTPGGARRSSRKRAAVPEPTPPPNVLDVGDSSGTVEVDPELEGVEVDGELDFDDLAAPPKPGKSGKPAKIGGARGAVVSSRSAGDGEHGTAIGKKSAKQPMQAMGPDDDDEDDFLETRAPQDRPAPRVPGPGTAVRNAVA